MAGFRTGTAGSVTFTNAGGAATVMARAYELDDPNARPFIDTGVFATEEGESGECGFSTDNITVTCRGHDTDQGLQPGATGVLAYQTATVAPYDTGSGSVLLLAAPVKRARGNDVAAIALIFKPIGSYTRAHVAA